MLTANRLTVTFQNGNSIGVNTDGYVFVNGKLRATVTVPADADDEAVVAAARAEPKIARQLEGMELVRSIVVKNKIVNLIVRPAK